MTHQNILKSYLTFALGGELFAIDVFQVKEIIEFPSVTKVPNAPDYLLGVMNLRGQVIPLVETRQKLAMPLLQDQTQQSVIIMELSIEGENMLVGGAVDKVIDVIDRINSVRVVK